MQKIKLIGTDLSVSPVCLGAAGFGSRIDRDTAFAMLDKFVAAGGNFIDTANIYARDRVVGISRSEEVLGAYLKARPGNPLVIATKGAHYDLTTRADRVNRSDIEADLDESLRTLGLDCIDFYYLHRDDPKIPIEAIVDILEGFVKAGKIRYYGGSNYTLERLLRARRYAAENGMQGFSAVSNYWTPATENEGCPRSADKTLVTCTEQDLAPFAELGIPFIPYSSTARGWFAKGPENAGEKLNAVYDNETNRALRQVILAKAASEGCPAQAALLRWMGEHGREVGLSIIPITSCNTMEQLEEVLQF